MHLPSYYEPATTEDLHRLYPRGPWTHPCLWTLARTSSVALSSTSKMLFATLQDLRQGQREQNRSRRWPVSIPRMSSSFPYLSLLCTSQLISPSFPFHLHSGPKSPPSSAWRYDRSQPRRSSRRNCHDDRRDDRDRDKDTDRD